MTMNSLAIKNRSLRDINRIKGVNKTYLAPTPNIDELIREKVAENTSGVELESGEPYMGFSRKQFWTVLAVVALTAAAVFALVKFKVIKI